MTTLQTSNDGARVSAARTRGRLAFAGTMALLAVAAAGCSKGGTPPTLVVRAEAAESESRGPRGKAISVQTVVPVRKDLSMSFEQPAPVAACEEADLYARASGYVSKVHVDIGDKVEPGQLLLELEVDDLTQELAYKEALTKQAMSEKDQAEAALKSADAALEAWPALLEQADADVKKADSEKEYRERHARRFAQLASRDAATTDVVDEKREQSAAAVAAHEAAVARRKSVMVQKSALVAKQDEARAALETKKRHVEVAEADRNRTRVAIEYTRIKSPFKGVITRRTVDSGSLVTAGSSGRGEAILQVSCIDRVTAVLRVPEREVSRIRVGTPAKMRLDALSGNAVNGSVSRFSRLLDEKSRTMRVEIDIENPDHLVYPGMYGPVSLTLREIKDALTVPAGAVYAVGGTAYVIVVADGRARRVEVKTGYDDGKIVEVTSGLKGGEEVVVSNKGQIAEGQEATSHRVDSGAK